MSGLPPWLDRWREPNPIVRKELLAMLRTPLYVRSVVVSLAVLTLAVVTAAVTLSDGDDASEAGKVLFQLYFGGAFLVMSLVGPTFGATSIVHEREARTYDALALSRLGPRRVVVGKLLAVFFATAFVPVVSVPVLGVAMLFGAVTLTHLVISTAYVLAFGAVGVAFGVAVSAVTDATRKAVGATVPVSVGATVMLGGVLTGLGHDFARRHALSFEGPFFFADAYLALPFDREYVVLLVFTPLWCLLTPLTLFYSIAHGGLREATQDRTLPLKRWAAGASASTLALLVVGNRWLANPAETREAWTLIFVALSGMGSVALLFAIVAAPMIATRRMLIERPGALTHALMPPTRAGSVWFVVALGGLSALAAPEVLVGARFEMVLVGLWGTAYIAALGGLVGLLAVRARASSVSSARVWGSVALFVTFIGTWIAALLTDGGTQHNMLRHPSAVLTLSPVWAVVAAGDAFIGRTLYLSVEEVRRAYYNGIAVYGSLAVVLLTAMTLTARRNARKKP